MQHLLARGNKWMVGVFFLILFVVGMLVLPDYGIPSDEQFEIRTLRYNVREYLHLLMEDPSEFDEYFDGLDVYLNFEDYFDKDYGVALYYPIAPLLAISSVSPYVGMLIWHTYVFLLFMLGCWALYSVIRLLFGSRLLGCVGVLLLYLSPRFFAEGHYNSKDTVMMVMTLVLLWQGILLGRKATFPRAVLFGFIGALAMNLRVVGLALFGLVALFVLIRHLAGRTFTLRTALAGLTVLVCFVGFYYILTPNAWGKAWFGIPESISTFSHFDRWDGYVLFEGKTYMPLSDPLPWYYMVLLMGLTTPVFILVLMLAGQGLAIGDMVKGGWKGFREERTLNMLLCTLMWLVPMVYFIIGRPVVYDGWRHFQFVYAPMLVLAVYGIHALGRLLKAGWPRRAAGAVLAGCLVFTAVGIASNHPYQFAYFNALAGDDVEQRFEMDYWFMGVKGALEQLLEYPELDSDFFVDAGGFIEYRLNGLPATKRQEFMVSERTGWQEPKYFLANPGRREVSSESEGYYHPDYLRDYYTEIFNLESYGNVFYRVYESNLSPEEGMEE